MSVAFRRESDEEHKEPRFEIPLPPGLNIVTRRGLELLARRAADLQARISGETEETVLTALKRDLRYFNARIGSAQVAPPPSSDTAGFGSRVEYRLNGKVRTIDIVGYDEADQAAGRVSFTSPLARALIGAGVGDFADFGGKSDALEVIGLGPIEE